MTRSPDQPVVLGWREWLALPALGLLAIRCEVDTGAATSALHATEIAPFERDGRPWVRFTVHPFHRKHRHLAVACEAPLVDERDVISSNGHTERRFVVRTALRIGLRSDAPTWPVELTLTNRASMRFPMLLGREAMERRVYVDPGASFTLGEPSRPRDFYAV